MMVMGDGAPDAVRQQQRLLQDNEITWFDWAPGRRAGGPRPVHSRELIAFRKRHAASRRSRYFTGEVNERGLADITWHGCRISEPGWDDPESRYIGFTLGAMPTSAGGKASDIDIHVMMNMQRRPGLRCPRGPRATVVSRDRHRPIVTGGHRRQGPRTALRWQTYRSRIPASWCSPRRHDPWAMPRSTSNGRKPMAVKSATAAPRPRPGRRRPRWRSPSRDTIAGYVKRYDRNS